MKINNLSISGNRKLCANGKKLFLIVLVIICTFAQSAFANIYTVTTNSDTGATSLRQAIADANANSGKDTILFSIAGSSVAARTITLFTALPSITEPIVIDGTSQPNGNSFGSSDAKIILDGDTNKIVVGIKILSAPLPSGNTEIYGLYITHFQQAINITGEAYDLCVIGRAGKGNILSSNSNYGIYISAADSTHIGGNLIGVDSTGASTAANLYGIYLLPTVEATIIGGSAAERNIISGNTNYGIRADASYTIIKGNYFGTDISGAIALPNNYGIYFTGGSNNIIGGKTADERNLISGNTNYGFRADASNTIITGNYIGTDITGTFAIANGVGIYFTGGLNNTIGGTTSGERNIVSGNTSYGIRIASSSTSVTGNYIGTDLTGTLALPNGNGIYTTSGTDNVIGGAASNMRNIISGNTGNGVMDGSNGSVVIGNYIGTDVTGTKALGNNNGVYANSSINLRLGGNNPGEGNLISGNKNLGVMAGSTNAIKGNLIGTNINGTDTLGNGGYGIQVNGSNTIVGGNSPAERNIISGNKNHGIYVQYPSVSVKGNYIGTDITGTIALGNAKSGIYANKEFLTVGGSTAGERNIISGNLENGIYISNSGSTQAVIKGNYIGVDAAGTNSMANGGKGVYLSNADRAVIGGVNAGEGNIIANNGGEGIYISGSPAIKNRISGNSIFCNSQISGTGGVILVTNANKNKAAPVIASASTSYIFGTAAANDTIELFYDDNCANCEGKNYITTVVADGAGNWSSAGTFSLSASVTATATDTAGNTSPFASCVGILTGAGELNSINSLTLFPNPASTVLNILTTAIFNENCVIEIIDVLGNEVCPHKEIRNQHSVIDISNLQPGVYFLKIEAGFGPVVTRFIKD